MQAYALSAVRECILIETRRGIHACLLAGRFVSGRGWLRFELRSENLDLRTRGDLNSQDCKC